ncbi:YfiT family bacillithiol transferase [Neobacillus niacini]|uniref:YfiT family bacillithiol transferase n=1 Tax=Neobacillus niacini TaxID=86668 RepID=UPI002859E8E4|nr:putative damage-inducible protein DinB [Neobacillus niacini]
MDLRYPVGKFHFEGEITSELIEGWIKEIDETPALLRAAVADLQEEQLDTPYRQGGWTVRQVIHHLADSHINSYVRFKLALTEQNPVIKPYHEDQWAKLPDYELPVDVSLKLLDSLHLRWVELLKSLSKADHEKTFFHPESGEVSLGVNIGLYAWHCRHHLAHITSLRSRLGW